MACDKNFAILAASVSCGVDAAAQFHQVFVGFQNQEGPVERHGDAHGGVESVARVAKGEHVAIDGRGAAPLPPDDSAITPQPQPNLS